MKITETKKHNPDGCCCNCVWNRDLKPNTLVFKYLCNIKFEYAIPRKSKHGYCANFENKITLPF